MKTAVHLIRPLALAAALCASPAVAAEEPLSLADIPADALVSDGELAKLRGGFSWEGVEVKLGAEVRSFLRDELVMQTNISWSAAGPEITRQISGTLTEAGAANLATALVSGGGITMQTGGETLYVANGGQTAFLQRVDGAFQNVVVNTANGAEIRQELDVELDLGNFAPMQAMSFGGRLNSGLAGEIAASVATRLGL